MTLSSKTKTLYNAMTTVLETSRIPPPAGSAAELRLPLSFLDYLWLHFHPVRHLLFYDYPSCSRPYFTNTLLPKLKQSLSLALQNYLPVAGNLLYPFDTHRKTPLLRYKAGDSVSLTIAESSYDFDALAANHARDADRFYDFVPPMPPPLGDDPEYRVVPVFALQVTLFPDRGICIGLANHHCLGDASSIVGFMQAFAAINKFSESSPSPSPVLDRGVIQDSGGVDSVFWQEMRNIPFDPSWTFPVPTNRVRATFVLRREDIDKLKKAASGVDRASSFVVATSYVWTCLAKSAEEVESGMFIFSADGRSLMNPEAPANYFGNCLLGAVAVIEHEKLASDEGFLVAATAIAEEIDYLVNNTEEFLKDAKNWLSSMDKFRGIRASQLAVSGSPKFDWGGTDFGWGTVRKVEVVSMDGEEYSMSLSKCLECEGGLEVGLSLPRERMNAFRVIFAEGLDMCDD